MKMVIFVEGLNELIFVRNLFLKYFNSNKILLTQSPKVWEDRGNETRCKIVFRLTESHENLEDHECLIIRATSGDAVLTMLKTDYLSLIEKGFNFFFGLIDLKSQRYKKLGEEKILRADKKEIEKFEQNGNIFFHYAKMETEAWYLAVPSTFAKIEPSLTVAEIKNIIDKNLEITDPETEFSNPAYQIEQIFKYANLGKYKVREGYQKVISNIDWKELCEEIRGKKISFFFCFLDDLLKALEKMAENSQNP